MISITRLTALAAVAIASPACLAQSDAQDIGKQFQQWRESGAASGRFKMLNGTMPPLTVDLEGAASRSIHATSSGRFQFTSPLLVDKGDDAIQVGNELRSAFGALCSSAGGQLDRKDPKRNPAFVGNNVAITELYSKLKTKELLGTFTCLTADGALFAVEMAVGDKVGQTLLPPGWSWSLFVQYADAATLKEAQEKVTARADAAADFRKSIQPGTQVALLATDVPAALLPKVDWLPRMMRANQPVQVCAMVVDVKPTLVQIQVETGAIFVPQAKLNPFRRKISPSAMAYPASGWDDWCVGT